MFEGEGRWGGVSRRGVLSGVLVAAATPFVAAAEERLEAVLTREIPRLQARYNTPGVAVALVDADAPPLVLTFGLADAASRAPLTRTETFQVGSISKFVTAILTLRLAEAGVLDLDAPVGSLLRRWRLPEGAYDRGGVTVRRILAHSAGLSVHGYFPGVVYPGRVPDLIDSVTGRTNPSEAVVLAAPPGGRFSYSGGGYSVLQIALEDLTGRALEALAQEQLFRPLGLGATTFAYDGVMRSGRGRPHDLAGAAMPVRVFPNLAAGGLSTTAEDLARLARAALAPGSGRPGLLSPAMAAVLATPIAPVGPPSPRPGMSQTMLAPETWPDPAAFRYAPGAAVAVRADGRRIVGHGGSNAGWKATVQYEPRGRKGIVVLTNGEGGNGVIMPVVSLWRAWLDRTEGAVVASPVREPASARICAAFARAGAPAAVAALRAATAAPDRWLVSDRVANDAAQTLIDFAPLQGWSPAFVAQGVAALARANAAIYPKSGFAQAACALALARMGDRAEALERVARAEALSGDDDTARLITEARGRLARAVS